MSVDQMRQDWRRNRQSVKSLFIVFMFRLSSWFAQSRYRALRVAGLPVRILYKVLVEFVMGVEVADRVKAGPGLAVFHGVGLVVNAKAVLGRNVTLRQNTTIGARHEGGAVPVI